MLVKRFVKEIEGSEPQQIWVSARKDGNGEVVSAAMHCTEETFNPITGFIQVERFMYWVKSSTIDIVERNLKTILGQVQKGIFMPYRVFSATPLHEGHQPDVNPSTQEPMDRYSQVRLGTPDNFRALHRTYIEVSADTAIVVEETTKEAVTVESGAEGTE
jgi:hypothetical protein